jgi:hypothetical protein
MKVNRTAASIARLMEIKDVTEEDAKAIRRLWHNEPITRKVREQIDQILRTSGVEYLGEHKRSGHNVYYCNAGDTYATTVLFIGPRLVVGCWGDLAERDAVRPPTMNAGYYGLI